MEILEKANFRIKMAGEELVIVVVQDHETDQVLMVAFMNREALERTISTGTMTYFSTTRRKIWVKGETSGNTQRVKEISMDCDGDALLFKVEQKGAACHEGYYSCFFRKLDDGILEIMGDKVFDPEEVYR